MLKALKSSKELITAIVLLLVVCVLVYAAKMHYDGTKKSEGVAEFVEQVKPQIQGDKANAKKIKDAANNLPDDGIIERVLPAEKTHTDSRLLSTGGATRSTASNQQNVQGIIADSERSTGAQLHYFKTHEQAPASAANHPKPAPSVGSKVLRALWL